MDYTFSLCPKGKLSCWTLHGYQKRSLHQSGPSPWSYDSLISSQRREEARHQDCPHIPAPQGNKTGPLSSLILIDDGMLDIPHPWKCLANSTIGIAGDNTNWLHLITTGLQGWSIETSPSINCKISVIYISTMPQKWPSSLTFQSPS